MSRDAPRHFVAESTGADAEPDGVLLTRALREPSAEPLPLQHHYGVVGAPKITKQRYLGVVGRPHPADMAKPPSA